MKPGPRIGESCRPLRCVLPVHWPKANGESLPPKGQHNGQGSAHKPAHLGKRMSNKIHRLAPHMTSGLVSKRRQSVWPRTVTVIVFEAKQPEKPNPHATVARNAAKPTETASGSPHTSICTICLLSSTRLTKFQHPRRNRSTPRVARWTSVGTRSFNGPAKIFSYPSLCWIFCKLTLL